MRSFSFREKPFEAFLRPVLVFFGCPCATLVCDTNELGSPCAPTTSNILFSTWRRWRPGTFLSQWRTRSNEDSDEGQFTGARGGFRRIMVRLPAGSDRERWHARRHVLELARLVRRQSIRSTSGKGELMHTMMSSLSMFAIRKRVAGHSGEKVTPPIWRRGPSSMTRRPNRDPGQPGSAGSQARGMA